MPEVMNIPRHIAIIMDGNGRWAEQRRLPRIFGHQQGVESVRRVVRECLALGVSHLTLYAFSSENWGRPADEVAALMELLARFLAQELDSLMREEIRLRVIGDITLLPSAVRRILDQTIQRSSGNGRLVLTLALSYGARDEILRAVRRLVHQAVEGSLTLDEIDETHFAANLDTAGLPDPDLLIRTSGEMRVSNFLLWQLAYAEFFFSEVLWPDFSAEELRKAIEDFGARQRRFGLTARQDSAET